MHWMCHLSQVGSALCCVCVETELHIVTVIPPQPLLRLWNLLYKTRSLTRSCASPAPNARVRVYLPASPPRAARATQHDMHVHVPSRAGCLRVAAAASLCVAAAAARRARHRRHPQRSALRRRRRHTIAAAAGARDDGAHKPSAKAAPRFTFATCGFDWSSSGEIKRDAGGASETQEVRATGRTQMGSGGRAPA